MPKAKLPTSLEGWIVAAIGSLVGLIGGFVGVEAARKLVLRMKGRRRR